MAHEHELTVHTFEAGADLSAAQYTLVVQDANGQVVNPSAGARVTGVNQDKPDAAGVATAVGTRGITKVVVGAAVTAGDILTPGSNGRAVAAGTGDVPCGEARSDGSGDGSVISALLNPQIEPIS